MFCKNCGHQFDDSAPYCPACGTFVDEPVTDHYFDQPAQPTQGQQPMQSQYTQQQYQQPQYYAPQTTATNTIGLVGFILAFLLPFAGLICSIMGYTRADKLFGGSYKGLSLAGIIISIVEIALGIVLYTFIF